VKNNKDINKGLVRYVAFSNWKYHVILIALAITLSMIAGWNFVFSSGYVYLHEQFETYTVEGFWKNVYPLWNERLQGFNLHELSKIYLYALFVFVAGIFNSYKLLQVLLLLTPIFIAFITAFKLSEYIISKVSVNIKNKYIFISSLISAFVFTVNPCFVVTSRNIALRFFYAFFPLILLLFIKMLNDRHAKNVILLSFILALIGEYRILTIIFLMLLVVLLANIILTRESVIPKIAAFVLTFCLMTLLSLPKFLPGIVQSYYTTPLVVDVFTESMIKREPLIHIFTTKIYDYPGSKFNLTYYDNMHSLFLFTFIFSILYLIFTRNLSRNKEQKFYLLFPSLIMIFFILISSKEINIDTILLSLPFGKIIGRLLRHAYWNVIPIVTSISIMVGISSAIFITKFNRKAYPVLVSLIIVTSISAWPFFTGDMNGYWRPAKVPEDYKIVNDLLKAENKHEEHHVLWLPGTFLGYRSLWSNQTNGKVEAPTGSFPIKSSSIPSYNVYKLWASIPPSYFLLYFNPLSMPWYPLKTYDGNIAKIYSIINVKYLCLHYDGDWPFNKMILSRVKALESYDQLQKIYSGKYLTCYKLKVDTHEFDIKSTVLGSEDGLQIIDSLAFLQKIPAVIFSLPSKTYLKYIDYVIISDNSEYLYFMNSNKTIIIAPSNFATKLPPEGVKNPPDPYKQWIGTALFNQYFHRFLKRESIDWRWQLDYNRGLIFSYAKNSLIKIKIEFIIDESTNYKLFIRDFRNQKGGEMRVYLDKMPIKINTKDQLNKFVWEDLGTFYLKKGKHEIVLENVKGFNAVNLLVLIPENEYYKAKENVERLLQYKTIIYIFEAESDLYRKGAEISKNVKFSNGKAIILGKNSKVWNDIEIVKNGTYRLALKGIGKFLVRIGSHSFVLSLESLNFIYSPLFYLSEGKYRLEIIPLNLENKLDVVWIYNTEKSRTIEQLFKINERPAEVISYKKIDPTFWKVKVNATKPFFLTFAEAYDPFWEARVYKDGKLIERVGSVPTYSVINGFWINQTGDLEIIIRYKLQDWFEIGLIISAIIFIGCVGYLFSDWRRKKW